MTLLSANSNGRPTFGRRLGAWLSATLLLSSIAMLPTRVQAATGELVAVREAAISLGWHISYNASARRIDLTRNGDAAATWLGSQIGFRNARRLALSQRVQVIHNRAYMSRTDLEHLLANRAPYGVASRTTSSGPVFPIAAGGSYEPIADNYAAARAWNPTGTAGRAHEGEDIVAPAGTPLVAVTSGKIQRMGWNEYGGLRITLQLDGLGLRAYYAHMMDYAPGLYPGARVHRGQLLGHVGSTGYGPPGTYGKFTPHLHFGLYQPDGSTIDPTPLLRQWEANRVNPS